jgi:hypothetical protein
MNTSTVQSSSEVKSNQFTSGAFAITDQDIATIDRILNQIDKRNAQLESFAYWKLALMFFKDFDLRFAVLPERSKVEPTHRMLLTSLLGVTECLHSVVHRLGNGDLERIALSKDAIAGNLRYLRSKYQQWYALVDPQTIESVNRAISNGTGSTSR